MGKKRELLSRAYVILALMVIVAMVLIGATVHVGIIQGAEWREKGDSTKLKYFDTEPERGNIYSADGFPLATSVPYFDLHLDLGSQAMTNSLFQANVDSLAICLSRHIYRDESAESVRKRLIRRRKAGDRYFLIKNRATIEELKLVQKFPLIRLGKYRGGLIVERKSSRFKPFGELAARTIGLHRENAPSVGIEGSYDTYLRGDVGKKLMEKVGNVWLPVNDLSEIEPERGQNIITTLDMRMQDICHHALKRSLINHDAEFGLVILMDVKTGAIRAMVNLLRKDGDYREELNYAIREIAEPGSTFKLASMMALLEDGLVQLDDSVNINHGRAIFGGKEMKDSEWHEETLISARRAFEISSNVGIAKLVQEKYGVPKKGEQFIRRLKQFGLDQPTGINLDGEQSPKIKNTSDSTWNQKMTLAWMAHGYELALTPLQTLTFYNAVANNGKKMRPYIVSEIHDGTTTVKRFKPEVMDSKIASSRTIEFAKQLLEGVVENGTAAPYKSKEYRFAGKTGTTVLEYWKKEGRKYQASFAGYFPAEDPVFSCIVLVNNPTQNGYYGGVVAGKTFREIADRCMATDINLMAYYHKPAQEEPHVLLPTFQVGYASDIQRILKMLKIPHEDESTDEWAIILPDEERISLQNRTVENKIVPNVVGMGIRDAVFILENRGLSVKVNGFGKVREQSIPAGSLCNGQRILLYLG